MNLIDMVNYLEDNYENYEKELRLHCSNVPVPFPILSGYYKKGFMDCKLAVIKATIEHSLDSDLKEEQNE